MVEDRQERLERMREKREEQRRKRMAQERKKLGLVDTSFKTHEIC